MILLNRDALYLPTPHELLVIRSSLNNCTTEWLLSVEKAEWQDRPMGDRALSLQAQIVGADFNTDLDSRLGNQRDTINRLLDHLREHCPRLQGNGPCSHG